MYQLKLTFLQTLVFQVWHGNFPVGILFTGSCTLFVQGNITHSTALLALKVLLLSLKVLLCPRVNDVSGPILGKEAFSPYTHL